MQSCDEFRELLKLGKETGYILHHSKTEAIPYNEFIRCMDHILTVQYNKLHHKCLSSGLTDDEVEQYHIVYTKLAILKDEGH